MRNRALVDHLLVAANGQEFPVNLLSESTEEASKLDWNGRNSQALIEVMGQIETIWTKPKGIKRVVQATLIFLANWLPSLVLGGLLINLIGAISQLWKTPMEGWLLFLSPLIGPLVVMICLHVLIAFVLPLRWQAIRAELEKHLEASLFSELEKVYCQVPLDVLKVMLEERGKVEHLSGEVEAVKNWMKKTEQSASIHELFGKEESTFLTSPERKRRVRLATTHRLRSGLVLIRIFHIPQYLPRRQYLIGPRQPLRQLAGDGRGNVETGSLDEDFHHAIAGKDMIAGACQPDAEHDGTGAEIGQQDGTTHVARPYRRHDSWIVRTVRWTHGGNPSDLASAASSSNSAGGT